MFDVYIDMDGTICDFFGAHAESLRNNPDIQFPQSQIGFFRDLEPIDYALSCIAQLEETGRFTIWFATAPSIKNIHCYTEKAEWIREYFGEEYLERLIIVPDKSKLIGHFLIDDKHEGKGQDQFSGELIHIGSEKWKSWIDVTAYLMTK